MIRNIAAVEATHRLRASGPVLCRECGRCSQLLLRSASTQRSRRKYQRMPDFSNAPATITAAKATNPVIRLPVFYTAP
jgi:hypothetical protein